MEQLAHDPSCNRILNSTRSGYGLLCHGISTDGRRSFAINRLYGHEEYTYNAVYVIDGEVFSGVYHKAENALDFLATLATYWTSAS